MQALSQPRVCTMGAQVSSQGYGCCAIGATSASTCAHSENHCINDNSAYSQEADALAACGSLDTCSHMLHYTNGNYYLRADKDAFYLGQGQTYSADCAQASPPSESRENRRTPAHLDAVLDHLGYTPRNP